MNLTELEKYISKDRLSSYFSLTGTSDLDKAIGAYYWNKALGGTIYPVLQCLEVSLRNSIHIEAWEKFNRETWYEPLCKNVGTKIRASQKKAGKNATQTANELKIKESVDKLRQNKKIVSASNVVASLTLGFWVNLLKDDYKSANQSLMWPELIPKVFSNLPKPHDLRQIHSDLKEINQLRNRFSHHEPLWKSSTTNSISDALNFLDCQISSITRYIGYINADRSNLLMNSSFYHDLKQLNTVEAFNMFVGCRSNTVSKRKFKSDINIYINKVLKHKKAFYIKHDNKVAKVSGFL